MTGLGVLSLIVYTFGTFAYGAIILLWVREWGNTRWAARPDATCAPVPSRYPAGRADDSRHPPDFVSGALFLVSFLWFLTNALIVLLELAGTPRIWRVQFVAFWLAFAFPPLIVHVSVGETLRKHPRPLHPLWRRVMQTAYVLAVLLAAGGTLAFFGYFGFTVRGASIATTSALAAMFTGAAVASILLARGAPAAAVPARERESRRWWIGLFGLMIPMFLFLVAFNAVAPAMLWLGRTVELATKSLPLVFMFVGTYFENRFEFFDLFIKRGLSLAATSIVLAAAFGLALPLLEVYDGTPAAPWVYAVVLLPVVMALPWMHARLGSLLDRRWLGRRFTTVDAVTRFLSGLRSATGESQLVSRAQEGLAEIFAAPVIVRTERPDGARPDFEIVQEVPARIGGEVVAWFFLGRRTSEAPYFSEDIVLLRSLADVFASLLHNLRLRTREQEQERRAQELSLHASRSELKALRAQINPHFLFNALNAIAGLIPREPAVADRTIEKLAEVFRYALRGADSEWVVLEDELEFARAYLDVEGARFGARLKTSVQVSDDARAARVPTMVVQTLVENAVKHGASAVRGNAVVEIVARREGSKVRIVVADNGPGFDPHRRLPDPARGGYGLPNIRQRLEGYFGEDALLTVERDTSRGMTVAAITIPFLAREPEARLTAAVEATR